MCQAFVIAWTSLALTSPTTVLANDTAMGGAASDLAPLTVTSVRMSAEDILIRHLDGDWEVSATYTFENTTNRPVTLQVGFPEYACEGGDPETTPDVMCDPKPLRFESMRTTVNGQPVVHRRGTLKRGHAWRPRIGQVWLFDVRFEPHQPTRIEHRYRVHETAISDGTSLGTYVTRTGATWAATIGVARFRIHVPVRSRHVDRSLSVPKGLSVTKHVLTVDGKETGEILLEGRDWEPDADVHFGFNVAPGAALNGAHAIAESAQNLALPEAERCTNIIALWTAGEAQALTAREQGLTVAQVRQAQIERFVQEGIGNARICRGYVFASYGRRFADDALNRYFYGRDGFAPKAWPYEPYEPNPGYSDAWLTPDDHATLELIDAVEQRLAEREKTSVAVATAENALDASSRSSAGCGQCNTAAKNRDQPAGRSLAWIVFSLVAFRLGRSASVASVRGRR